MTEHQKWFSPNYKNDIFLIWYQHGKPGSHKLSKLIPGDEFGDFPTISGLNKWIQEEYVERGHELDGQVNAQIAAKAIAIKIEMLERHANMGEEIQTMAISWLKEHTDELTMNSAVRLLVEGVRIERESRGLPEALEGLANTSDDDLLKQIEKIVIDSPVTLLPNDSSE